jgi:membrane associated rhomboid family serine protease
MFILVTQADGSAQRFPWVTYAMALLFVALFLQQRGATEVANEGRREAIAYLNQNPDLEVAERFRGVIPLKYAQALNEEFLREKAEWGFVGIPGKITARGQREFNEILKSAFTKVERLPVWKYGVRDTGVLNPNWWGHFAAHETQAALVASLILLMVLGIALEDGWGHMLFGGVSIVGIGVTGIASTSANYLDATGYPWFGASGLLATLLGAYLMRSLVKGAPRAFGMIPMPGMLLLPVWFVVEYVVVRGIASPSEFISATAVAHGAGFALGAVVSGLVHFLGFEDKMLDRAKEETEVLSNPTLERAMIAKEQGRSEQAYGLLRAEFRRTPTNQEVAIALWDTAVQTRNVGDVVEAMWVVIGGDLKAGRASSAAANWFALIDEASAVGGSPQTLVHLGEVLLDEGHPEAAIESLTLAVDGRNQPATPLLLRTVRIARDLDAELTLRAAVMALQDKELSIDDRVDLTELTSSLVTGESSGPNSKAPKPAHISTPAAPSHAETGPTMKVDLEPDRLIASTTSDADIEALDSQALDLEAESAAFDSEASADSDSLASWNHPGCVDPAALDSVGRLEGDLKTDFAEELNAGIEGELDDLDEFDESNLVEALMAHEKDFGEEATALTQAIVQGAETEGSVTEVAAQAPPAVRPAPEALAPRLVDSMPNDDLTETTVRLSACSPAPGPMSPVSPTPPTSPPTPTPYRKIKVREGVPAAIESDAIVVEIDGGSKTRVPFARIEAVAAAAVSGLREKPVVVIDLVVNWSAAFDPIKVIRLRSDRFDPGQLVPGHVSQVDALRKMLSDVVQASNASALPSANGAVGSPFDVFASLDDYHRMVLGGKNDDSASNHSRSAACFSGVVSESIRS